MKGCCSKSKLKSYGLLFLRLAVGAIFIRHGWLKLTGIEEFANTIDGLGLPGPALWAWLVAIVEFLGGLAVLLGVYLRAAAKMLSVVMIFALLLVHTRLPLASAELPLALLGGALTLLFVGGGSFMLTQKDCACKMCGGGADTSGGCGERKGCGGACGGNCRCS